MSVGLASCVSFFFKQKTAYEVRISDWSSDVCSSDQLKVVRADKPLLEQLDFYPVDQAAPEFGAYQYNGRGRHFAGLNQRQDFEELVQRTEAARQSDIGGDMHTKRSFS